MASSVLEQIVAENPIYVRRLNVRQLRQMIAAGVFAEGESIELIDGLLVYKDRRDAGGAPMSHGPRHARAIRALGRLAARLEPAGFAIQSQLPVTLSDISEPEPDGAIIRHDASDYQDRHPGRDDVAIVIEVADASLKYDRTTKQRLYASATLPIYWIVNLQENVVEVYTFPDPVEGTYRNVQRFRPGEPIRSAVDSTEIEVDPKELLS